MLQFSSLPARVSAAVIAAAVGGAVLTQFVAAPAAPAPNRAGLDVMQRLRADHAQIADYIESNVQAQKFANAAASRDVEQLRLADLAAASEPPQRLAQVQTGAKRAGDTMGPVAARIPAKPEPVRVASNVIEPGEPLQLMEVTGVADEQTGRPPLVRAAVGAMRGKLGQLASTVERVPSWLGSAADWVSDAVPVSRRLQRPGREFRASL